jgi:hypothetical protein
MLLKQLTKAVIETALAEEMAEHLGYEKHDPAGMGSDNIATGTGPKRCYQPTPGRRAGQRRTGPWADG